MTNSEAASSLTVSPHTINMHLRSIYGKLGVTSRSAATRFAVANELV
jgi:DNA-binding CsgD family transcriptional regulator